MKIRYLGTGAIEGIPALFCNCPVCANARKHGGKDIRHRTCAMINSDTLIDISPDIFSQAITLGLDLSGINQILITHTHSDHFYIRELLHIMPPYSNRKRDKRLKLISSGNTIKRIESELTERQMSNLRGYVEFIEVEPFMPFESEGYTITALPARHRTVQPYIYIIEKDGSSALYGNDSGFFREEVWDFIYGMHFDFVSLDCAHLLHSGTPGHMCIEDNVTVKKRLYQQLNVDKNTKFVATHFAHTGGIFHEEIEERLRLNGIYAAYDGFEVEF